MNLPFDLNDFLWYHYTIVGLGLLLLIFLIANTLARRRLRLMKKAQLADQIDLSESGKREKWFRVLTQTLPKVFWIRNQRESLFVSKYFEELIGYPEKMVKEEFPCFEQVVHVDDREWVHQNYQQFLKNDSAVLDHSFRLVRRDGTFFWLRENVFHYLDVSGEKFLLGLLEDVTEKQESIEQLKDSQIFQNNILNSSDEGILVLNKDFSYAFWNPEMEVISGNRFDDICDGKKAWEHFPHLIENGVAEIMKNALKGEVVVPQVYKYTLPNQRKGFTLEKYLPLKNHQQDIIGVLGFVKDVTEEIARERMLEDSQEKYALTLQAVNDGIWDWDFSKNSVMFSDQWFSMLGYSPNEISSSVDSFLSLLKPDISGHILEEYQKTFTSRDTAQLEYEIKTKDGNWMWVIARGRCIEWDQEGKPIRALGTQSDISIRKQHEFDLIDSKEKAEESDKLKTSFLANVSHELRTPLNAIVGFADLLVSQEFDEEEQIGFIKQIRANSDQLSGMITSIIDISSIQTQKVTFTKSQVEVVDFLKSETRKAVGKLTKEKNHQVQTRIIIPANISNFQVEIDPDKTGDILQNLLDNAYKFTEKGSVKIGFHLDHPDAICFFITDTGIGIKEDNYQRIFNLFEQGDQGWARKYGGTGLGLFICKSLIELAGGKIWLDSNPGMGSTFSFTLPIQTPSETP